MTELVVVAKWVGIGILALIGIKILFAILALALGALIVWYNSQ